MACVPVGRSEWQIVGTTLSCRFLSRREGGSGSIRLRREGSGCRRANWGCGLGCHLTTDHIIGTDFIKPTPLILMGINIKLNGQILAVLNVELLDPVFAKEAEDTSAGELTRHLYDILLRHPWVTCAG